MVKKCRLFMRQNNEFKEIYNCHLEDTLSTSVVVVIVGIVFAKSTGLPKKRVSHLGKEMMNSIHLEKNAGFTLLDSHFTLQRGVLSPTHLSHATFADLLDYAVMG